MFFDIDVCGKIMVCAESMVKPNMVYLVPPSEFTEDEMHDWRVKDGEFVYTPAPVPPHAPTQEERIKALEDQFEAYEAAYAEGVNEA